MQITNQGVANTNAAQQSNNLNPNDASSIQNEFITLMVAQIQNQDPLNPQDATQYVNQLATMSQVQGIENMVQMQHTQQILLDNLQVLNSSQLVGMDVTVRANEYDLKDEPVTGTVELQAPTSNLTVKVVDESGNEAVINLGENSSGPVEFTIDPEEHGLKGKISIEPVIDDGQNYVPDIFIKGKVTGIEINGEGGSLGLHVEGLGEVPMYEVGSFS
ncbi:flagellar hook capping FlgD N-terminal domain-containing protein [Vibrio barjaei]|uniref:flagellar hook capping FlgD N-terminal domain-containing protein n=1 Tax=Vibrio barjaei TaxID=1676683 RepID=UPI0022852FEE|nr:flagellar hook capping FlgD N-terminal domain-containing protein [Vibrio barjaei]MCY9872318.1 flagellar hook assembly protein FlgD [Vibrio barjaei]